MCAIDMPKIWKTKLIVIRLLSVLNGEVVKMAFFFPQVSPGIHESVVALSDSSLRSSLEIAMMIHEGPSASNRFCVMLN